MAKAQMKTKANDGSVQDFLGRIANARRREDAFAILKMMQSVTRKKPRMWGSSIVGFDEYHYKYESGREGDMCLIGFSPRSQAMTLYLGDLARYAPMLGRLGKHTNGQGCLHVRKLEDVDRDVLKQLVSEAYKNNKTKHK